MPFLYPTCNLHLSLHNTSTFMKADMPASRRSPQRSNSLVYRTQQETSFDSRWSQVKVVGKNIPARSNHIAVIFDTKMYVHGGHEADRGVLGDFACMDFGVGDEDFEWKVLGDRVNGEVIKLKGHTAVAYRNKIVVFGGEKTIGDNSNAVYTYDVIANKWQKVKTRTTGTQIPKVQSHCAAVIGDTMFVYGGYIAEQAIRMGDVYGLNLDKMQWSVVYKASNAEQEPPLRSNSAMVAHEDHLWTFGGTNGERTLNDMWKFDTKAKKWGKIICEGLPEPRRGHSMVGYKDYIFLFGGIQDVTKEKNDVYVFELKQQTWHKIHTFTNSVYDCSPTLKKYKKKDSELSPDKFSLQRLSPEKSSQNADGMKKILAENKHKKFMEKKKEMLKQFNQNSESFAKNRSLSPTTQSLVKTLESIGNQQSNKNNLKHQIIYDETGRLIIGKKPCARDGQTMVVGQGKLYIFGGDRHLMSFNDLYQFDLEKGLKSLELYRSK